jgi:hypothetical protein
MQVVLVILGMFLDWVGILLLAVPIFVPIIKALGAQAFGLGDEDDLVLWFGVLYLVNMQMSFLSPPFGYALFYLRGVAPPDIPMIRIFKSALPFLAIQLIGLVLCMLFRRSSPGCQIWSTARVGDAGQCVVCAKTPVVVHGDFHTGAKNRAKPDRTLGPAIGLQAVIGRSNAKTDIRHEVVDWQSDPGFRGHRPLGPGLDRTKHRMLTFFRVTNISRGPFHAQDHPGKFPVVAAKNTKHGIETGIVFLLTAGFHIRDCLRPTGLKSEIRSCPNGPGRSHWYKISSATDRHVSGLGAADQNSQGCA